MLGALTLIGVVCVVILQIATLLAVAQEKQRMGKALDQINAAVAAEAASDQAELQTLQGSVSTIAADVDKLVKANANGSISDPELADSLAKIQANTSALKSGVDAAVSSLGAADQEANAPTGLAIDHTSASLSVSGAGGLSPTAVVNTTGAQGPEQASSSDPTIATVAPATDPGPNTAFTITAVAPGSATVSITDGKTTVSVNVGVAA